MEKPESEDYSTKSFWSAFLIGVAIMAAVDEIIFHQILAWHHFYDRATPAIALASDGFLHAAEIVALVVGFMMFSRLRRAGKLLTSWSWAGLLWGAGAFQVFDGIVDHKVLRLHQIRYGTGNLLLYDLAWNSFGLLLIVVGIGLQVRARRSAP